MLARFENAIKYKTGENNKEHPGLSRLQMIILLNEFGVHASPMQKKFDYHSALQKIQYSIRNTLSYRIITEKARKIPLTLTNDPDCGIDFESHELLRVLLPPELKCQRPWIIMKILKEQPETIVYLIESETHRGLRYIFKYILYMEAGKHGNVTKDAIYIELYYQERAAAVGVAPRIYQINEYDDGIAIIMEAFDTTLKDIIDRGESTHKSDIIRAMQKLTDIGIEHRDLHTENIMRNESDPRRWYIIDYGLATDGVTTAEGSWTELMMNM